jgi:hypothetical protein
MEQLIVVQVVKNSQHFLELQKIHYCINMSPPLDSSQINLAHILIYYTFKLILILYFHTRLGFSSALSGFPTKIVHVFLFCLMRGCTRMFRVMTYRGMG